MKKIHTQDKRSTSVNSDYVIVYNPSLGGYREYVAAFGLKLGTVTFIWRLIVID